MLNTDFLEEQMKQVNEQLNKQGFIFLNQVYEELAKVMYEAVMRDFSIHPEKWIDYSEWIAGGCKGPMYKNSDLQLPEWICEHLNNTDEKYIDFNLFDSNDGLVLDEEYWKSIGVI